jgi:hypothetical protein
MRSGRKAYEEVCKALPALTRARFAKTILWSAHGVSRPHGTPLQVARKTAGCHRMGR